ncbi:dynein heavy chain 14, axonemal [Pelobates cultripes]|uniref:Dynein heavy chain 14, axonemal n=1 Tax=Pelobates cultripes TaxID=61616 RepID=A0AAD1RHZ4_PELCU|nr:dynein heavy chain 14, axonemal [Pelobates cultripes]
MVAFYKQGAGFFWLYLLRSYRVFVKLRQYSQVPEFNPKVVGFVSNACRSLCQWVLALEHYHNVRKTVEPKQRRLSEAKEALRLAQERLKQKQKALSAVEEHQQSLQRQYNESVAEKDLLAHRKQLTAVRLKTASVLISALDEEKVRWQESVNRLDLRLEGTLGNLLVSAAFIVYCGVFTSDYRMQLVGEWLKLCETYKIPASDDYSVIRAMASKNECVAQQLRRGEAGNLPALCIKGSDSCNNSSLPPPQTGGGDPGPHLGGPHVPSRSRVAEAMIPDSNLELGVLMADATCSLDTHGATTTILRRLDTVFVDFCERLRIRQSVPVPVVEQTPTGPPRRDPLHSRAIIRGLALQHQYASRKAVRRWQNEGLPPDPYSTENAILVKNGQRWPLLIDPHGQAFKWICQMEGDRLQKVQTSDPGYIKLMENAIRLGEPVLLQVKSHTCLIIVIVTNQLVPAE